MALAGDDGVGPEGCKRRGLHCGRQAELAPVGAACPALPCRLSRCGLSLKHESIMRTDIRRAT
eukprot:SAG25_NODE_12349_length_281_cov_1.835165_1_plen_62_part_10